MDNAATPGGIEISEGFGSLIRLWGDVDASLRDQASAAMAEVLQRGGPYVIDVSEVSFIDSSGLAFILQLHRVAADEDTHVVLRDPPTLMLDMLDLIGASLPLEFSTGRTAAASVVPDDVVRAARPSHPEAAPPSNLTVTLRR